jgi:hypothetical protein
MNQPELSQNRPKQSNPLKWILLGCGGLILLIVAGFGVMGYMVARNFNTDPARVEAAAQEILTFEKPAGLKGAASMNMMGFRTATFVPEDPKQDGAAMLMVATFPAGKQNQDQFQQQIDANMKKQGQSREGADRLPPETFKVRGNDVTAQVTAIKDQNSDARSLTYMLTFENKPGKIVMVTLSGKDKSVDHAYVQKFLDTVK